MSSDPDILFRNAAVVRGLLTDAQGEECLKAVREALQAGRKVTLAEIAEERGLLSGDQVRMLRAALVRSGRKTQTADPEVLARGHMGSDDKPSLPRIPGYEIVQELGRGGMGVVYKARQKSPRRWVALKVMLGAGYASENARMRFRQKAEAAAGLNHPGVVTIFDVGEQDGCLFYTMEFVEAIPLGEYLGQHELSIREKIGLLQKICEVVHHAHEHGVIHRDLKPSNVMIDDERRVRILDFGLAKFVSERGEEMSRAHLTKSGATLGTPAYMSPEQTRGIPGEVDSRSDVYALGVILYEMLTGEFPYPVKFPTPFEVFENIREKEPRRPASVDRKLRGDLETILLKSLDKEKERRYQTAAALAADLQAFVEGKPISARPTRFYTKLAKFTRRNRVAVLFGAAAVTLVVVVWVAAYLLQISSALSGIRGRKAAERTAAWERLRHLAPGTCLETALDLVEDPSTDSAQRIEAFRIIFKFDDWGLKRDRVERALSKALRDEEEDVRLFAATEMGPRASCKWLVERLAEPLAADVALLLIPNLSDKPDRQAAVQLKRLLVHKDPRISSAAGDTLIKRIENNTVASPSPQDIAVWLTDKERNVRLWAAYAAALLGSKRALLTAPLLARLQASKEDPSVRKAAAESLLQLASKIDLDRLERLLANERDDPELAASIARLVGISPDKTAVDVLCDSLERTLNDEFASLLRPLTKEVI